MGKKTWTFRRLIFMSLRNLLWLGWIQGGLLGPNSCFLSKLVRFVSPADSPPFFYWFKGMNSIFLFFVAILWDKVIAQLFWRKTETLHKNSTATILSQVLLQRDSHTPTHNYECSAQKRESALSGGTILAFKTFHYAEVRADVETSKLFIYQLDQMDSTG